MRCPKCGYISFDRVERCGKCANDLAAVAAQLQGPMAKVAAPMFLGSLLGRATAAVAEEAAEEMAVDLAGEELDLGEVALMEEPEESVEAAVEEEGIEMPGLGGLDVSDLVAAPPAEEEEAPPAAPEVYGPEPGAASEAEGGEALALEEMSPAEEPLPAEEQDVASLDFDLTPAAEETGEEDVASGAAEEGGVVDLSDLLGLEAAPAEEPAEGAAELEDLSFDLGAGSSPEEEPAAEGEPSLSLEEPEPAAAPAPSDEEALDLTLDSDESALGSAAEPEKTPDIPDLGLTLEGGDEESPGQ